MSQVRYITDTADFENTLKNQPKNKLLIVCYTASWCGPCKTIMAPLCESVAAQIPELKIVKVDVDDCEELASTNDISCMPTLHFYKNGVILNRLEGADKNTFLKLVSDLV